MSDQLFTIPEVAARLGYSTRTVYRLIEIGDLHAVMTGAVGLTKRYRVRASALDRYIETLEVSA